MAALDEVLAVEQAYRAAQARLGVAGAYLALVAWASVNALSAGATAATWTAKMVRVVVAMRRRSRKLAQSYYQLSRALQTGTTLGLPEDYEESDAQTVPVAELRRRFLKELNEVATMETSGGDTGDADLDWFDEELKVAVAEEVSDEIADAGLEGVELDRYIQDWLDEAVELAQDIVVDEFQWPTDTPDEVVEDGLAPLLEKQLDLMGQRIRNLRTTEGATPEKTLDDVNDVHTKIGNKAAGQITRTGLSAGRQTLDRARGGDGKVMLVARVTGANPCAFCSMLASRGFWYHSEESAGDSTLGDAAKDFHDNCKCTTITRWVPRNTKAAREEANKNLPPTEKFFHEQWPVVTDGYKGIDALNKWRRWLYGQDKDALNETRRRRYAQRKAAS